MIPDRLYSHHTRLTKMYQQMPNNIGHLASLSMQTYGIISRIWGPDDQIYDLMPYTARCITRLDMLSEEKAFFYVKTLNIIAGYDYDHFWLKK